MHIRWQCPPTLESGRMGSVYSSITPVLAEFIAAQPMFFVATAPLSTTGHINLSPKGLDTFRILSPTRVAYLDLTGSGIETAAHILENGRITLMFCAFQEPPKILRLYGHGRIVRPDDADWTEFSQHVTELPGTRQIIVAEINRVHTSCGFGVPLMSLDSQRDTLIHWAQKRGPAELVEYRAKKNAQSIDGLPGWNG
jgi:hypothetical protein